MNKSIFVHGPQGCGKSLHATRLAQHFGLSRVLDDWWPGDAIPATDTLILTHSLPPLSVRRQLSFDEAMRRLAAPSGYPF